MNTLVLGTWLSMVQCLLVMSKSLGSTGSAGKQGPEGPERCSAGKDTCRPASLARLHPWNPQRSGKREPTPQAHCGTNGGERNTSNSPFSSSCLCVSLSPRPPSVPVPPPHPAIVPPPPPPPSSLLSELMSVSSLRISSKEFDVSFLVF